MVMMMMVNLDKAVTAVSFGLVISYHCRFKLNPYSGSIDAL